MSRWLPNEASVTTVVCLCLNVLVHVGTVVCDLLTAVLAVRCVLRAGHRAAVTHCSETAFFPVRDLAYEIVTSECYVVL